MNFLAHAYLSFGDPDLLVGNMIGDFVKGRILSGYTPPVQQGIRLHRTIDQFTDMHPATRMAKSFFQKDYGLYSGVFVDIVYDHFLGNDLSLFTETSLSLFTEQTYEILAARSSQLPVAFQQAFYYMRRQDWLYNYRLRDGVFKAFRGIVRRAKYLEDMQPAFRDFEENYKSLESCYQEFFPVLLAFAKDHTGNRS